MSERIGLFQKENAFNSSEIAKLNRILARDSQYSATCSLGPEEETLVVRALISDPVSDTFTQAGAGRAVMGAWMGVTSLVLSFFTLIPTGKNCVK